MFNFPFSFRREFWEFCTHIPFKETCIWWKCFITQLSKIGTSCIYKNCFDNSRRSFNHLTIGGWFEKIDNEVGESSSVGKVPAHKRGSSSSDCKHPWETPVCACGPNAQGVRQTNARRPCLKKSQSERCRGRQPTGNLLVSTHAAWHASVQITHSSIHAHTKVLKRIITWLDEKLHCH